MDQAARSVTYEGKAAPLLATQGLTKRFGSLTACDHISLEISHGEVHALLGENGAGKSTLVKMLYGALAPDEGSILWEGGSASIGSPAEARRLGIGMVFQHFSLFEALSVSENIALALPPRGRRDLAETIRKVSSEYGLPLDPDAGVSDLSVGERQRVEIVRCLLQAPRLIIMDEPTSVLTRRKPTCSSSRCGGWRRRALRSSTSRIGFPKFWRSPAAPRFSAAASSLLRQTLESKAPRAWRA